MDASARDLEIAEIKTREHRYLQAADAALEQVRTIELLAPKRVAAAALQLCLALPDIVSHEAVPVPAPDFHHAVEAFVAAARTDLGAVD